MDDQSRNLILATALSFLVILTWFLLFPPPEPAPQAPTATTEATRTAAPPVAGTPTQAPELTAPAEKSREAALAQSGRVQIETPRVAGSLSLTGARVDDLELVNYRVTIEKDSPTVTLFTPAGVAQAYYALYGWSPAGGLAPGAVPGPSTVWSVESGDKLTPATPVSLVWDNGAGLVFKQVVSIDENYMFTVAQSVENNTGAEVRLAPYGIIARHGMPPDLKNFYILHEGVILVADGELEETKYKALRDLDPDPAEGGAAAQRVEVAENGWIGFTDHYWMSTLVAQPQQPFTAVSKYTAASDTFQTDMRLPVMAVPAGGTAGPRPGSSPAPRSGPCCATTRTRSRSTASSTPSTGAGSSS